jgi:hypothetical protein
MIVADHLSAVTKIKKELITKAKVKKQYAKIKAEHQKHAAATSTPNDHPNEPGTQLEPQDDVQQTTSNPPTIHPERQAMLDSSSRPRPHPNPDNNDPSSPNPEQQQPGENQDQKPRHQRRPRKQRPDYYTKELAAAERAKKQAEERRAEFARREQERQQRIAERERYRKAMAKAKAPGRDGKPKIGRESKVLLERVKKIMGES